MSFEMLLPRLVPSVTHAAYKSVGACTRIYPHALSCTQCHLAMTNYCRPLLGCLLRRQPILCAVEETATPRMSPTIQLVLLLTIYALHVCWISQVSLYDPLRHQHPNLWHHMESEAENLIGALVLLGSAPRLRRTLARRALPWTAASTSTNQRSRPALLTTLGMLVVAYLLSGHVGSFCQQLIHVPAGLGYPLGENMQRALQVPCQFESTCQPARLRYSMKLIVKELNQ